MQQRKVPLPIDSHIEQIMGLIQESSTILIKASPGSGKTTRLPWAITRTLAKTVIVLEPRRIAAKLAAERIAEEEDLGLGEEIGYQFRFERRLCARTKLIFYTEGTFLRKLIHDPELKNVGAVILDEFHERHLETDMAFASLRALQKKRHDLKVILMSATLETAEFPDARSVDIDAPRFPVEVSYLPNTPSVLSATLEQKVRDALKKSSGDTLVFLPGMREILKVQQVLGEQFGEVHILHSEVSAEEQHLALAPAKNRKIILSTNIAESSVTIPGITTVVDSGIQREAHYSPWNGLKFITDRPVTKASATQRAGRAGRTGPGVCLRLYSQQDFDARETYTVPEILKADLTEAYLLSKELGSELAWPVPPPEERWKKAQSLCEQMNVVKDDKLTEIGRRISEFPVDVRLSRVLLAGERLKPSEKLKLVNFLSELENDPQLRRRLQAYQQQEGTDESWEKALLTGFVDQVALYRSKQHDFIHYSGKTLKAHSSLNALVDGHYLVLDISQRQEAINVVEIDEAWLFDLEPFPFTEDEIITAEFTLKRQTKLGSLVVDESEAPLNWSTLSISSQQKLIEITQRTFQKKFDEWRSQGNYARYLTYAKLKNREMPVPKQQDFFAASPGLDWDAAESFFDRTIREQLEITDLERILPSSINLGGRRELKIHYEEGLDPYLEAPIQEFYGLTETPKVGGIPVTIKLLGPHKRPIQVTKDIAGFWKKTYQEMKRELQRDYPRHYWPDEPGSAKPVLLKSHLQR
jgi:ATP-dependent helicase HrpB